jgi:hypothetical protein
LGLIGGFSPLFFRIALVIIHSDVEEHRIFDRLGTVLLIVAVPMTLIGSIFLDWITRGYRHIPGVCRINM